MVAKYKKVDLEISTGWNVERNEFYDIDPNDEVPDDDKFFNIYVEEDMLAIKKGRIFLDLGWYGGEDSSNEYSGYCIHLIRGNSWNDCELLEKFRSRSKNAVVDKINELILAVDRGEYDELEGLRVDENDPYNDNDFSDLDSYSIRSSK